ncbi:tetratricopeptide repeat protein [Kribbella italica]|uniref:Tetratricopeptide (TPR) repeat protein n=1 Tax=Kribbella italica TaxID=1540520 RepID=A0A7W9J9X2_9ACTN|nr:tetratricopeptide repeat protein [Kribbella italica]MBB5838281.1 tetratricopeptide (TPR) repeat protein [Kribbella italica]
MDAHGDGTPSGRTAKAMWDEWKEADRVGDAAAAGRLASEMTAALPQFSAIWFEAGMYSKARGEWAEAVARNQRAVDLFTAEDAAEYDGENPAAWNLGIAATAIGDWATARSAWTAYGIEGIEAGTEPIDVNFGYVPIRVNPDRPSLPHQVVPEFGDTEVIWCRRRSPAHAVISSVPLPASGHRFRDVLLHDGEPKGTRRLGEQEVAVFDQLARLESSDLPTWQAQILGTGPTDLDALADLIGPRDLGLDDWSSIRLMCADCSHGSPGTAHTHTPAATDATILGLAGSEADLRNCLDPWLAERPHVVLAELTFLW